MVLRLVSGGQTGVDRAALEVARELALPYGGWCPAGGWAEDLPDPPGVLASYPALVPTPSADPAQRTEWNVRGADATLVIAAPGAVSRGTDRALEVLLRLGRPGLIVEPGEMDRARAWLDGLGPSVALNVCGPRESEAPGHTEACRAFLRALLAPRA